MAKKEKFGKFVLLEEIDTSGLGTEYRAAKLSQTGLEKVVSVLRLAPTISAHAEVAKSLMDQAKVAAQLQNPNIVKIYGIGKVDTSYYISYEFIEGKSLKAIFQRGRSEGFPFSVDHTLLIASKICSALEYAHGRKSDGGARYFHGLLTPASVVVSYEGEVRVRGFGYWPGRVRDAGLSTEESLYLAPEQTTGGGGDTRSDIFAVGAILFEMLTGHPLFEGGRTPEVASRLSQAKLHSPSGDDDSLPKPIADILRKSLAVDSGTRYAEAQEMRKAIDTLLFSGDFTPTTFNLAFFMHSLFREDIERESRTLKEEKESSYFEYLTEEPAKSSTSKSFPSLPAVTPVPGTVVMAQPSAPAVHAASAGGHAGAGLGSPTPLPLVPPPPRVEHHAPVHHEPAHRESHTPVATPIHKEEPPGLTAKEAAAGFTFHKGESSNKLPLLAGVGALVLVLAVAGYWVFGRGPSTTPSSLAQAPATLSPEVLAAQQKVKELEERLRQIEEEKAQAEQKAKDEAAAKLKREAQASGRNVDPATLEKAQKEAADKARAEQERRAQEEKKRLEDEKRAAELKAAEEQRLAAEKAAQEEQARKVAEAAAATTLPPPTTAAPAPALKPGSLVNITDLGVTSPTIERKPTVPYPPIAQRQRVEGTVELSILVDERGNVTDAQVVAGTGGRSGLNEAAIDAVKKYKYRPATKDGVAVKVWIPVKVKFELPK
jgi:TonB family protein